MASFKDTSAYDYMVEFAFTKQIRDVFRDIIRDKNFPVSYATETIKRDPKTFTDALRLYSLTNLCPTKSTLDYIVLILADIISNIQGYNYFRNDDRYLLITDFIEDAIMQNYSIQEMESMGIISINKELGHGVQGSVSSIQLSDSLQKSCPSMGKGGKSAEELKQKIVPRLYNVNVGSNISKEIVMKISPIFSDYYSVLMNEFSEFILANYPSAYKSVGENLLQVGKGFIEVDSFVDMAISIFMSDYKEYGLTPFFPTCYTSFVTSSIIRDKTKIIKPRNVSQFLVDVGITDPNRQIQRQFINHLGSKGEFEEPVSVMLIEKMDMTLNSFIRDTPQDDMFFKTLNSIFAQIILGLSFAQSRVEYVHGDFHGSNIMIKNVSYSHLYYRLNIKRLQTLKPLYPLEEYQNIETIVLDLFAKYGAPEDEYLYFAIPTYGKNACAIDNGRAYIKTKNFNIYNNIEELILGNTSHGPRIPHSFNEDVFRLISSIVLSKEMDWAFKNINSFDPNNAKDQNIAFIQSVLARPRTFDYNDPSRELSLNIQNNVFEQENVRVIVQMFRLEKNKSMIDFKSPLSFLYYFRQYIVPKDTFVHNVEKTESLVYEVI